MAISVKHEPVEAEPESLENSRTSKTVGCYEVPYPLVVIFVFPSAGSYYLEILCMLFQIHFVPSVEIKEEPT